MSAHKESKFGILVPDGKHIRPSIEKFLDSQGIKTELWSNGRLHADVKNAPVTLTFQNHADVIGEVEDGISQAGFVGSDRYAEYLANLGSEASPTVIELARFELFNPRVRLSLLVRDNPEDNERYRTPADLRDRKIITTYPGLVLQFLRGVFPGEEKVPVEVYARISGKEEGHVDGGRFEAAGVIVDTGTAMRTNHLRELAVIMTDIQPILVYNSDYFRDRGHLRLLTRFRNMVQHSRKPSISLTAGLVALTEVKHPQFVLAQSG